MKRAMALALVWCLVVGLCAFAVGHLTEHETVPDGFLTALLFPLTLITGTLSGVVDLLGPSGRHEPASNYLSQGSVVALAVLSLLLYWLSIALLIFSVKKLWIRWRRTIQPLT